MPLISKPNYNQIFASQAPEQDKPAVFNNYPEGWGTESRPNNGKPTIKGFNYLQQTSDLKDLWILQNGACLPYDESIEYAEGAPVLKDGVIQYKTASGFSNVVPRSFYGTLAEANADIANIAVNQAVNIGEVANGGLWHKATAGATSLTKSPYDPLPLARQDINEAVRKSSNITLTNAGLTLSEDQLKVSMINFIGTLSNAVDVTFPEIIGQWTIRNGTNGAQVITLKCGTFTVVLPVGQTITVYKPTNTSLIRTDGDKAPLVNPVFINATTGTAAAGTSNLVLANTAFAHRLSHGAMFIGITDDVALTEAQSGVKTLTFNGTLTKDVTVTVPFSQGSWNVKNDTTGGFSIKFKSANPPFAIIPNGESRGCFANAGSMNMLPVGIQSLPTASKTQAGMVIAGNGVSIDAQGIISVDGSGGGETNTRKITVLSAETVAGVSTPSARIMSDDGMICFGIESRYLKVSFDWGKTFTGTIFDAGTGKSISQVRDTNDGELICVLIDGTVTPQTQAIYKTTGWNKKAITQTWTKVLEVQKPGVTLNFNWGFSKHRNIIICTEYGAKVGVQTQHMPPEGAQPGENARYVYMSTDNGTTWKTIFDVNTVTDGEGVHIHGAAFDPYWNRIWVSHGDGFLGTNGLYYSDDFGFTWVSALETQGKGINFAQTVHIVPMKTCILFASDSYPNGIHRIDRAQGKMPAQGWYDIDTTAYLLEDQLERLNYLCHSVSKPTHLPDLPVTFAFGAETQPGYSQVVSTFDGWTFFPLWKDPVISAVGQGARSVIGPTYENEIIIHCTNPDRASPWERTTLKVVVE